MLRSSRSDNVARAREDVGAHFVDTVGRFFGLPTVADTHILRCLRQLAASDPTSVLALVDQVTARVSLAVSETIQTATGCCVELVQTDPSTFIYLTPTLSALIEGENETIRSNALYILTHIAHEYPEEATPAVPQIVDVLTNRNEFSQTDALSALGAITAADPAATRTATESLAVLTTSPTYTVRANATALLADIAQAYPAAVADHIPALVECVQFQRTDPSLCQTAISAVCHVSVEYPTAVTAAIPVLIDLLASPSAAVRRIACTALGQLTVDRARTSLQAVAMADPDTTVRLTATWALERLSDT